AVGEHQELQAALDRAYRRGVLLVAAAGNQGRIGPLALFPHAWVIPVTACNDRGQLQPGSNIGPAVGRAGLMAPGVAIRSTRPWGVYVIWGGPSAAAPFVPGPIALLWSLFPHAGAGAIRRALLLPALPRRAAVPPLLDAERSRQELKGMGYNS